MNPRKFPVVLLLPLLAAVSGGCGSKADRAAAAPEPAPVTVRVQVVERKSRPATEDEVGTVRARLHAVIAAKVTGRIGQLPVVPGQNVRSGELLAQVDAQEIQARLDQARAVRQQADDDLKRFTKLWQQKVLSQAEFDTAQSKFRVADAAYLEAETLMSYTKIVAPFDGVITRKLADVGDLATPGKPLLEMEDARSLRLEADVPEAAVDRIAMGEKLPVRISALETNLVGTVVEIAPAADPYSRTFLVKLDLPSTAGLRAGQFGRVAVPVGETSALRVPAAAVLRRGQLELVFVVADGRAQMRIVKTGKEVGDEVELVSGVDAGEKVIVDPAGTLLDGQPVKVEP